MNSIDSGRITLRYAQRIEAPPARVFPLLCPIREGEWLDGWIDELRMIHSESGLAEEGCVFQTQPPGRAETVWMVTRHDPVGRVVEFVRFTAGLVVTRLTIGVDAQADDSSKVNITYAFTPLSAAGRNLVRETYSADAFRRDMAWWESSMNHWLRTGEILRSPAR